MTQQLYFEPAWERTISEKDRQRIEELFDVNCKGTQWISTYLYHATNHHGSLLYTVLLNNYSDDAYIFQDKQVTLLDKEGNFITDTFTLPVEIPSHRSMPWTFIFPKETMTGKLNIGEASLLFEK